MGVAGAKACRALLAGVAASSVAASLLFGEAVAGHQVLLRPPLNAT